jgi:hypothetical protein
MIRDLLGEGAEAGALLLAEPAIDRAICQATIRHASIMQQWS